MAKGEAKKTNRYIDQERDTVNRGYNRINDEMYSRLDPARQRADQTWNAAYGGYNDILGRLRNRSSSGPSASFDPSQYNELYQRFRDFGDTGGVSEEEKRRIRGNGVFDEFARTGGLSESDKANLRARSTSTLPSFFENLKNNLDRTVRIQGGENSGFNPGYNAQAAALARDQAYGANRVAAEAEGDIVDRVTQGRQWGASSLSDAERALVNQISSNRLGGWGGALNARQARGNEALQYEDLARANRSMDLEAELGALAGMRGLRTDQPGEEFGLYDRILEGLGGRAGAVGNNLNLRAQYNPNKSFLDNLEQVGGIAAGMAGAFMGMPKSPGGKTNLLPKQRNLWGSVYG